MEKDKLITKVCQDTGDIFARLFDHRPFLNGEIQQFVREFEEKKGNRDIELLLKSCEKLTDLRDSLNTSFGDHTKELISSFLECISETTTKIEEISLPKVSEESKFLQEREALRQQKREQYFESSSAKILALDNLIKEKELELRSQYQQLEEKLKNQQ